jgi:hypothetical protein
MADQLSISASIETVFDTVVDTRNEPSYNPTMTWVELLTPEPIGRGTRFRALMGKKELETLVEVTEYDRPHRYGAETTSSILETSGTIRFTAEGDMTIMAWDWQVQPKGWLGVLGPLFGPLGSRMERKIWTGLKTMLDTGQRTA